MTISGLPKPVIMKQVRCITLSKSFQYFDFTASDIVYTSTPLYHTVASGMALMSTLDQGELIFISSLN